MSYILMATASNLPLQFYTGRAGFGWVSQFKSEAFEFATEKAALWKAHHFSKFASVHGFKFTVMPVVSRVRS